MKNSFIALEYGLACIFFSTFFLAGCEKIEEPDPCKDFKSFVFYVAIQNLSDNFHDVYIENPEKDAFENCSIEDIVDIEDMISNNIGVIGNKSSEITCTTWSTEESAEITFNMYGSEPVNVNVNEGEKIELDVDASGTLRLANGTDNEVDDAWPVGEYITEKKTNSVGAVFYSTMSMKSNYTVEFVFYEDWSSSNYEDMTCPILKTYYKFNATKKEEAKYNLACTERYEDCDGIKTLDCSGDETLTVRENSIAVSDGYERIYYKQ